MKLYDEDGNLVEGVMTADEVAAKLAAEKAAWEAAQKPADPAPATPPEPATPPAPSSDEPPAWAKELMSRVETLSGVQKSTVINPIANHVPADKREDFNKRLETLTGYGETPEELARKAQDAYLLTVGQPLSAQAINFNNVVASGNAPTKPTGTAPEVDKAFAQTFGITEQDVSKYGNKS